MKQNFHLLSMIKDTTLVSLGGLIHDVYWRATKVGPAEFKNLEALTIAAIIYLILITIISLGAKKLKFVSLRQKDIAIR